MSERQKHVFIQKYSHLHFFFFHNQGNLAARRLFHPTPFQICVLLSFSPPSWLHAKSFFPRFSLYLFSRGTVCPLVQLPHVRGWERPPRAGRKQAFFVIRDLSFPASQRALSLKGCLMICEERAKARFNISDGTLFGWLIKCRGMFISDHSGPFAKFIESVELKSVKCDNNTNGCLPNQQGS